MPEDEVAIRSRSSILGALGKVLILSGKENTSCGLILLKILSLRDINTMYGYEKGDLFISKFLLLVQDIFPKEDFIVRISNDEFAILLNNILSKNHIILAINRILRDVTKPLLIKDDQIHAKVSMGVALYPVDANTEEELLISADIALGNAVEANKSYRFFSKQNIFNGYSSTIISHELDTAIDNFELALLYQPKIDLQKNAICGAECLMRWTNPRMGSVPAEVFIPISESTGQIMDLTVWSLNVVFRQAQQWCSKYSDFQIAVNLSAAILYDPNIIQMIRRALNMWSIEPQKVMFEITESAVMLDPEHSLEVLKELTEMGLYLSIDDFGTGYSSLAYLKCLPVSELKIDKSFVLGMTQNEDDKMIVRTIIELAHNFKLSVIAEGVEDNETMDELKSLGCDKAQGYNMSRPVAASDLNEFIQSSEWKVNPNDHMAVQS
jgi:diguanylate cyclase (GGDEF)-like protein